jgi:hypothetical protein
MQVSLQSKVCLATCVAINAYDAYSNYASWVSFFVIGLLRGSYSGSADLQNARQGLDVAENHHHYKEYETRRWRAVNSLTSSFANIEVTALNLLALGFISQRIQLPSGSVPQAAAFICRGLASLAFSWHVGRLFQLEILQKNQNPKIQKLLDQAII